MDNIDITDSVFSLDIPESNTVLNSVTGGSSSNNYTMYIYIGIAALIILGGMYVFKMYQNRKNSQSNENYIDLSRRVLHDESKS